MADGKERRSDWEQNQAIIERVFLKLMKQYRRRPTTAEVSRASKLSVYTIQKHIKSMNFAKVCKSFRHMTPVVIRAILEGAIKGKSEDKKLFLQVMENWKEGMDISGTLKVKQKFKVGKKEIVF